MLHVGWPFLPLLLLCFQNQEAPRLEGVSLEALMNITLTTASKASQSLGDAPAIVTVITAEQIRRMGAQTLFDVLDRVPGFTTLRGANASRTLVVRGIASGDGVLVMVDGVTVNDPFTGNFNFFEKPVGDIERLEIIRGPGSALFGGYALVGVIHIFTHKKQAQEPLAVRAQVAGGSYAAQQMNLSAEAQWGGLKAAGSFSRQESDGDALRIERDSIFTIGQGDFLPPLTNPSLTPAIRNEAFTKYNAHLFLSAEDTHFRFFSSQLTARPLLSIRELVTQPGLTLREDTINLAEFNTTFRFGQARLKPRLYWVENSSRSLGQTVPPHFRGDASQNGLNENFFSGFLENFSHVTQRKGLEAELDYALGRAHSLTLGLVYEVSSLEDVEKIGNVTLIFNGPAAVFPTQDLTEEYIQGQVRRDMLAVYLQDQWAVTDLFHLTLGARFGDYSDFGQTLTPRVGFVYHFGLKTDAKLLYGKAFKPPSFLQLFDGTPTLSPFHHRGNDQLEPTEITTAEFQLRHEFTSKLGGAFSLYFNETADEIFFNATPGIERWQNTSARTSKGFELELLFQGVHLFDGYANYAYQNTDGVVHGIAADIHPRHRLNLGGSVPFGYGLSLNGSLHYFGGARREDGDVRPELGDKWFVNLKLMAERLWNNLDLSLTMNNALDEDGRDETALGSFIQDDIPREGRRVLLQATVNF